MLFLIGATSHIGSNETEKPAYETTEVKFAVCSVMADQRENRGRVGGRGGGI